MKNKEIKAEVIDIMKIQLRLLYIDDDKIDKQEALHKVDLQEIFALSYDEFSVFDKFEALLPVDPELVFPSRLPLVNPVT